MWHYIDMVFNVVAVTAAILFLMYGVGYAMAKGWYKGRPTQTYEVNINSGEPKK